MTSAVLVPGPSGTEEYKPCIISELATHTTSPSLMESGSMSIHPELNPSSERGQIEFVNHKADHQALSEPCMVHYRGDGWGRWGQSFVKGDIKPQAGLAHCISGPRLHYGVQSSVPWYQREPSKSSDTT